MMSFTVKKISSSFFNWFYSINMSCASINKALKMYKIGKERSVEWNESRALIGFMFQVLVFVGD